MAEKDKKLPTHIAIIMDGNGRWARKRMLPRTAGHKAGMDTFIETVDICNGLGIQYLTVYAFSAENWNREQSEVNALMELMSRVIVRYVPDLHKKNIKLRIIGDINRFEPNYRAILVDAEARLAENTGMTLSVCLSYGGRQELVHAFNSLAKEGKTEITESDISSHLYTADIPNPDLVIRTSGEYRISNFLLWQSAYAEYYFSKLYWPDFNKAELLSAIDDYQNRERRFGR